MAINMDLLKKKLNQLQTTTNRSAYLWKPKPGKNQIRIVPYQHAKSDFPFIELYFHYNIGKKSYLSLETFGEADPICKFVEQLRSTGDKDDWKLSRKLEPTMRTFVPIIERGKEKEGIKFWGFGKEIYKELLAIINDADYGDITDLESGRDITVEFISAKDAGNTYGKVSIRIKPNVSAATDDDAVMDMILNRQPDIYDIHKKVSYEDLEAALNRWLTPVEGQENAETSEEGEDEEGGEDTESGVEEPENDLPFEVDTKPEVKSQPKATIKPETKVETKAPEVKKPAGVKPPAKGVKDVNKAFEELFDDK